MLEPSSQFEIKDFAHVQENKMDHKGGEQMKEKLCKTFALREDLRVMSCESRCLSLPGALSHSSQFEIKDLVHVQENKMDQKTLQNICNDVEQGWVNVCQPPGSA